MSARVVPLPLRRLDECADIRKTKASRSLIDPQLRLSITLRRISLIDQSLVSLSTRVGRLAVTKVTTDYVFPRHAICSSSDDDIVLFGCPSFRWPMASPCIVQHQMLVASVNTFAIRTAELQLVCATWVVLSLACSMRMKPCRFKIRLRIWLSSFVKRGTFGA